MKVFKEAKEVKKQLHYKMLLYIMKFAQLEDINTKDEGSFFVSAEQIENNMASISGLISSELIYSHTIYGETFYYFMVDVIRLSKSFDKIPVTTSERIMPLENYKIGSFVEVDGQFRSYNKVDGESKLMLTLFARDVRFTEIQEVGINTIELNGYICKKPIYRVTPFKREIADILLAVNRPYNRSDYIPCILWGRNARYASTLIVGDNVVLAGRVQSREYQKVLSTGESIDKTAYEVSVSRIELVKNEVDKNSLE